MNLFEAMRYPIMIAFQTLPFPPTAAVIDKSPIVLYTVS